MDYLRPLIHIFAGLGALGLPYISAPWALVFCALVILLNVFSSPRLFPGLYQQDRHGRLSGIAFYPAAVFLLIALFGRYSWIVAGAWGMLAAGDGMATITGRLFGRRRLPYNTEKSVVGMVSFIVFGTAAGWYLMYWNRGSGAPPPMALGWFALAAASVAALVESARTRVNDNLTVPLTAALVLLICHQTQFDRFAMDTNFSGVATSDMTYLMYILINVVLAINAFILGAVRGSGAGAGALAGTVVLTCTGWRGYLLLVVVVGCALVATRFRYREKQALGIAQEPRTGLSVLAILAAPAICAWLVGYGLLPENLRIAACVAMVGALATALADTLGTELGTVLGRTPFALPSLRPVAVGTRGGISVEGTFIGLLGALLLALLAWVVGVLPSSNAAATVLTGAFLGSLFESYPGPQLEKRDWISGHGLNFMSTLLGGTAAGVLYILLA
jgi:uncharacterized protein (TIGR00297 family)